ncbi:MAG: DNA-deoxyinosine glycosylase [Granulosicoccus sp.]
MTSPPSFNKPVATGTSTSESFAPLAGKYMHTLVLGTMPGQKSLHLQQYYAHQRNSLWPILCAIVKNEKPSYTVHKALNYQQRCDLITSAGYALWDVLAQCERPGSLDGNIVRQSEIPNAVPQLLSRHPELRIIACNGRTAETLFKRHILPQLSEPIPAIIALPSTSPAMASLSLHDKHERWRNALTLGPAQSNCTDASS